MNINFRPIGRTGNVAFQAAAALGYAKKHGCQWGVQRNLREVPHFLDMFPNVPVLDGEFKRYNRTDPSQFNYQEMPKFNQDTTLCGFFQSIKYFEHCQNEVKKVFKLDIKPIDAVSIHVRRGDYVTYSNSFPPVTHDYIDKGVKYLSEVLGYRPDVLFFSDDIEFVSGRYGMFKNTEFCYEKDEFKSLSLMASCSHHIIANSTFSWWGAFLGHNPNRIIVSPDPSCWFGPGFTGNTPTDLIPDEWIKIKYEK